MEQVPYKTNVVSIGVSTPPGVQLPTSLADPRHQAGQRTDIIVTATGKPGDVYWMRIRQPDLCNLVLQPFGLAGQ